MAMLMATEKQIDYMSILFIDCGFTLKARKEFLKHRFGRDIAFLDDLSRFEASQVIEELRDQKEQSVWKSEQEPD
jgi:hypothetical protein